MKKLIRKSVAIVLTGSALGLVSTQASALTVVQDLAVGDNVTGLAVPARAWSDYNAEHLGWTHTAHFYRLTVGTTGTVQITVTGTTATTGSALIPAFTLWSTGDKPFGDNAPSHKWDQTSGPTGINAPFGAAGGCDTFGGAANCIDNIVGWANAGAENTNSQGHKLWHVGINDGGALDRNLLDTASPYLAAGSFGSTGANSASLTLVGLAAGNYLIALGGNSCALGQSACPAYSGGYNLSVQAVPIPAAVWLFGSALAGMGVIGRKKSAAPV